MALALYLHTRWMNIDTCTSKLLKHKIYMNVCFHKSDASLNNFTPCLDVKFFLDFATLAFSFVCNKYYLIID